MKILILQRQQALLTLGVPNPGVPRAAARAEALDLSAAELSTT